MWVCGDVSVVMTGRTGAAVKCEPPVISTREAWALVFLGRGVVVRIHNGAGEPQHPSPPSRKLTRLPRLSIIENDDRKGETQGAAGDQGKEAGRDEAGRGEVGCGPQNLGLNLVLNPISSTSARLLAFAFAHSILLVVGRGGGEGVCVCASVWWCVCGGGGERMGRFVY